MDSYFLGGDIGGTASRFVLCDQAGTIVQRGAAAGATGHTFNAESRDRLEESIAAIAAQITKPVDAAVFGGELGPLVVFGGERGRLWR